MSSTAERAAVPDRLGEFRVLAVLGEGAYGTVYAAERDVAPGAGGAGGAPVAVALKVLRAEILPTERQRKLFLQEATLLASVDHPGVVKVLGFGLLPDDRPYLAMERLDGESLAERLRRGALGLGEALARFRELCDALAALHERGLLHRDVKPENVFLAGAPARAVLFDFGIAKGEGAPASTMTQDGAVRGTPAYMAPERFFGAPASTASEVYELGVTLYAMLAGRLPWDDAGDPESRLHPKKPSEVGVELPAPLESELLRALSTRAENRPASVRELEARIGAAVSAGGAGGPRRTLDLPAAEQAGQLPARAATVSGGALPGAGGPAPTEKVPRRSRWGTAAFALAAVGVASGVGAFVGRLAWKDADAVAHAPDAGDTKDPSPEPAPEPAPEPDEPSPGPRRPPLTQRVPDTVWKHHPRDTAFLLALSWTQVVENPAVMKAAASSRAKAPEVVRRWRTACGFDPVSELEWATLGAGEAQAGEAADIMIAGRWTRDDFEACLAKVYDSPLSDAELRREGALTWARLGGREVWFGWVDEHTVFFSLRKEADRAWVEARLAGKDGAGGARGLAPLRKRVDEGATMWLVTRPRPIFGEAELDPGVPTPEALTGWLALGKDVRGEVRFGYGGPEEAERVRGALQKRLDVFMKDVAARLLLGESKIVRDGRDVVLTVSLDEQSTEAVLYGTVAAVAQQVGKMF
jgi:serine/threonine protein kinase